MADDEAETESGDDGGGGKKKPLILIVVGIVLIGLTIGGTLLVVKMLTPEPVVVTDENAEALAGAEADLAEMKNPAIYFPLKPPVIVNFPFRGRQRFMQAEVSLMTREEDVIEAIQLHMPMLRNSLILRFSGYEYEELQTEEGRELLRQESLQDLRDILQAEIDKPGIEKLLFTNLVMQ